jgi:hypothetical protein
MVAQHHKFRATLSHQRKPSAWRLAENNMPEPKRYARVYLNNAEFNDGDDSVAYF